MVSKKELNELKSQLEEMQHDTNEAINSHDFLTEGDKVTSGELSSYDNHPADSGTDLFDRERDLALVVQYKQDIREINEAIQAIENGTYGKCRTCGKDISFERLEAMPTTFYCVEHSKKQEIPEDRSREVIDSYIPSQGKYDLDTLVGYDAEDTWQDVAHYGTSDTQSDMGVNEEYDYNHMYLHADEKIGYVEDFEANTATDITGRNPYVIPNRKNIESTGRD